MSPSKTVKKNISGMQVIKTLQVLLEDNYTMEELVQKLNENEKEPIFNNSVVSKYINTCRYCGIDIPKIHNKYFVASLPFGLTLENEDIELLENLQKEAMDTLPSRQFKLFNNFIEKLSKYSNKHIIRVEKKNEKLVDKKFEIAVAEKRRINLMFRKKATVECIPLEIVNLKDKKCFKVMHKGKERLIAVDRIAGLEIIDKKFSTLYKDDSSDIVFKLYGDLAKRYTLKDNEHEVERKDDEITITNNCDDFDSLISRLLRYDSCCEIVKPQFYRDKMKRTINDMLANYGE